MPTSRLTHQSLYSVQRELTSTNAELLHRRRADAACHSPDGITFLREMTSWPPFLNYDVRSKSDSTIRCVFTWRTFLANFIPIRFETTEPIVEEVAPTRTSRRTRL